MDGLKEKIDNTMDIFENVLESNKENENVKEAYEDFINLKEKRNSRIE